MSAQELTPTPVQPKNELKFHNEEAHQTLVNEVKKSTEGVVVPEDHDAPPQQGNEAELDYFLEDVLKASGSESLDIGEPKVDPNKENEAVLPRKPFLESLMNSIKGFLPSLFEEIKVAWTRRPSRETTSDVPLEILKQYASDHNQDAIHNEHIAPQVVAQTPEQAPTNISPFPNQEKPQAQSVTQPPASLAA